MAIAGSAYTSASVAYSYDNAYQLTKEARTGGSAYTKEFWYDSGGNRTKSALGGTPTTYYYDDFEKLTKVGTEAVQWDYWGNITKVSTQQEYLWDDSSRLTMFDSKGGSTIDTTYGYLPGSWKRYKRTQSGTTEYFIFDGDDVLGSYASNGTLNARYITPGLDTNLSETRSGSTYYYMADGLGSVRNVVDSSETVQSTYDYRGFGDAIGTTPTTTRPYGFTGREYEAGSILDMHYYRNRYYLAGLGIFMSRDVAWADEARGWGYVGRIPTMLSDPLGFEECCGDKKYDPATQCCHNDTILNANNDPPRVASCTQVMSRIPIIGLGVAHAYLQIGNMTVGWAGGIYSADADTGARECNWATRRKSGKLPDGTPCKCATPGQIQQCVKSRVGWDPQNGGFDDDKGWRSRTTYTYVGRNCGTWATAVAKACCLDTVWTAEGGEPVHYGPGIW